MNKRIQNTDVTNLLFFDIECVRASKELNVNSTEFDLYQYKNRNRDTGDFLPDRDVQSLYSKSAALSPIFGKIVCISIGYILDTKFISKNIVGEEKDIIEEFINIVNNGSKTLVCYNGIPFDLNYILLRACACGITTTLNEKVNTLGKKEWHVSDNVIDLMLILKGTGWNNYSLNEIAYLLDVKSPKDDINGSEVSDVYWAEGVDRIATYCAKDILCTAEILLALQGKRNYITEVVDKTGAKVEKIPLMNAIANTKAITKDQEKEIVAKAKTLSVEEKPLFVELLKAALLENAVNYDKLLIKIGK